MFTIHIFSQKLPTIPSRSLRGTFCTPNSRFSRGIAWTTLQICKSDRIFEKYFRTHWFGFCQAATQTQLGDELTLISISTPTSHIPIFGVYKYSALKKWDHRQWWGVVFWGASPFTGPNSVFFGQTFGQWIDRSCRLAVINVKQKCGPICPPLISERVKHSNSL